MNIHFNNAELSSIYEGRPTKIKFLKSNPALVRQYVKTIKQLKAAENIELLLQLKGLGYEKLEHDRVGQSSVRINNQYRLIFVENYNNATPPKIILLSIEEITDYH